MMSTIIIVGVLWVVLMLVWLVGRFTARRVKRRESPVVSLGRIILLFVLSKFLFNPRLGIGWLGGRLSPRGRALDVAAIVVTALGVAVAIWARVCLAANWSGTVTLKEGHELIRARPYRKRGLPNPRRGELGG